MRTQLMTITNEYMGNSTPREAFSCLKVTISQNDSIFAEVKEKTNQINRNLNPHSANGAIMRSDETVDAYNLIGLLAEYACLYVLRDIFGDN